MIDRPLLLPVAALASVFPHSRNVLSLDPAALSSRLAFTGECFIYCYRLTTLSGQRYDHAIPLPGCCYEGLEPPRLARFTGVATLHE